EGDQRRVGDREGDHLPRRARAPGRALAARARGAAGRGREGGEGEAHARRDDQERLVRWEICMRTTLLLAVTTALVIAAAGPARAGNVDLTTLPPRAAVELTIYNSEDLTLVRERRVITFKKGANRIQFSWANTLIDPT